MAILDLHVYGRVSRLDPNNKSEQDKSLTIQEQAFLDACDTLIPTLFHGHKGNIVDTYKDEGKSASRKKAKRPDFNRLLKDIDSGIVKVLMVLNLSRFSRLNHLDALKLHLKLHEYNVKLVSIDDRKIVSIDDLMGFIQVAFQSNNDHEYARTVGKNTLRGSIQSVREGQARCKDTPYGMAKLFITDKHDEIVVKRGEHLTKPKEWKVYLIPGDLTQVKVVQWIYKTYAESDTSPAYIARQLNKHDDPVVTQGCNGKGWSEETVRGILANHHYNSKVFYGKACSGEHYRTHGIDVKPAKEVTKPMPLIVASKVPEKYPAVIDDDLFDKVQKKLTRNKANNRRAVTSETREGHCLSGILACGHCKRSLYSFNPRSIRYQCRNRVSGCKCWSVAEDDMLPFILKRIDREIIKQLDSRQFNEQADSMADYNSRLTEIDKRIIALESTLKTARIESIPAITATINDLHADRQKAASGIGQVSKVSRIQAAYERWEALIEPLCVGIKTGNVGDDNEAVKHLGLQDEVDRLFNTTLISPSAIRNLLNEIDCRVECFFAVDGKGKASLENGRLTCCIDGISQTDNLSLSC